MIASGEVGTPDAVGKKDVADDDAVGGGHIKTDTAVGVTGGVQHLQFLMSEADDIPLLNVPVGVGEIRFFATQPECGSVGHRTGIDSQPRLVHQQGRVERTDTISIAQDMVNMGVRINNIFDFQ